MTTFKNSIGQTVVELRDSLTPVKAEKFASDFNKKATSTINTIIEIILDSKEMIFLVAKSSDKAKLEKEKQEILSWMESHTHPSLFPVWSDYVEKLSKDWTYQSTRLKELNSLLNK